MDDSRGRIEKLKTKLNRRCLAEPDFQRYFQVTPPVALWPKVERRGESPADIEEVVAALEHAV